MRLTRRGLLVGAAAGGGLLVAWYLYPRNFSGTLSPGKGEQPFGAWLKIADDGVVTVAVPQLEMGQGIATIIPQIVAAELGADWRQMAVEPAPPSGAYANVPLAAEWAPLWMPFQPDLAQAQDALLAGRFAERSRFAATFGGTSLAAYEMPCREAAASARWMLSQAASERWDVAAQECEARAGFIIHGDKRLSFGELADEAAAYDPPDTPPLQSEWAAEIPIPGLTDGESSFPRLDLPAKVDGSLQFAGDVRLPDMVYAAIRHGHIDRAELTRFNAQRVAGNTRLVALVDGERWLAAVATDWWSAQQALDRLAPVFRSTAPVSTDDIERALDEAARDGEAQPIAIRGAGYNDDGAPDFNARYEVAPALHAPIETASCTARITGGRLEVWLATQAPEAARQAAADAAGVSLADTVLYPMQAGGSFDARMDHHHAIEAAKIARETGRPVQLVYSRWQEHLRSLPRPPAVALMNASLNAEGAIAALSARIAMPATMPQLGERLFGGKTRWAARRAAADRADPLYLRSAMPQYGIPDISVEHVPVDIALPVGPLRGNGHALAAFFTESLIDEIAAQFRREPLSYRIAMLGGDRRMVGVLQAAARLARWDGGSANSPGSSGQGLACHRIGDSATGGRIACVATAGRGEGGVRVTKLSCAVDIGRIVNLDIARQQIEGGLVFGMAMAMGASTDYADGLPTNGRLADLNLPTLADCPQIEIDFIASQEAPADPGELGVAVAAPAIANALFSATGLRLRRLPLFSEGL